jgi:hypothetical protein
MLHPLSGTVSYNTVVVIRGDQSTVPPRKILRFCVCVKELVFHLMGDKRASLAVEYYWYSILDRENRMLFQHHQ